MTTYLEFIRWMNFITPQTFTTGDKMPIKSKRTSNPNFPDRPKMLIHEEYEIVVLFTSYKNGVVVHSEHDNFPIGYAYADWKMKEFENYYGTVTIQNS